MSAAREIVIPIEKPQRLKVLFNNSAYMLIKKLTGVSAFDLMGNQQKLNDPEMCMDLLFAGTRKHHSHPEISKEQVGEWLDMLDGDSLYVLCTNVITEFSVSFLPRGKRQEIYQKVDAKMKEAEKTMKEVSIP